MTFEEWFASEHLNPHNELLKLACREAFFAGAKQERDACARQCDDMVFALDSSGNAYRREATASQCAKAIRSTTTH